MENNFETLKEGSSGDNVIILQDKLKLMNVFLEVLLEVLDQLLLRQ